MPPIPANAEKHGMSIIFNEATWAKTKKRILMFHKMPSPRATSVAAVGRDIEGSFCAHYALVGGSVFGLLGGFRQKYDLFRWGRGVCGK